MKGFAGRKARFFFLPRCLAEAGEKKREAVPRKGLINARMPGNFGLSGRLRFPFFE